MVFLKVISWNISGCNHVIKRKKILTYLKQNKSDIAMLQETHLSAEESEKFKRGWIDQVYSSTFNTRSRGVAILIKKGLDFKVHKTYNDHEGRWIALDSSLEGQKYTIMNIYAPYVMSLDFFNEICNIIRNIGNYYIILGGDFNQVRNIDLDKSSTKQTTSILYSAIDTMMDECGLIDIWRTLHPLEKDFTFFSHPHQSYSRIDYILISKLVDVVIMTANNWKNTRWPFNHSLLQNEISCSFIQTAMDEYWLYNEGSVSDPGITWDAFKAFLRGRLIQHCSLLKRLEREKLVKLEETIRSLKKHYSHPDPVTFNKMNSLKLELNDIIQKKTEFALFCTKQNYYEKGERAGKYLAHRVKQLNKLITDGKEMNKKTFTSHVEI
uniref:exodeoxyribonuclease III n=1 Tax=Sinocyclocheilus rhinocerous TaxID=307959 RepID=A0A673IQH6_9TELE